MGVATANLYQVLKTAVEQILYACRFNHARKLKMKNGTGSGSFFGARDVHNGEDPLKSETRRKDHAQQKPTLARYHKQ